MRVPRVVVGLSGGVDSSVSAYLLKKKGFDVVGVYMENWDPVEEGSSNCSRSKDQSDARNVSNKLNIPFHTVNFVKEYWNDVFQKFLENYKNGRTVVPDIDCNRSIKFNYFHDIAIKTFNADYIATGHYASTSYGDYQENPHNGDVSLICGADPLKDQTFFLCTLKQEQLKRAMFPLGSMYKTEVKRIAKEQGFESIAKKAESMGICFVGKKASFEDFLNQYIEERSGNVVLESGDIVGEHNGIHHFTIGKRIHGKYLSRSRSHLGYFVVKIDSNNNTIVACEGSHHPSLYATRFIIQTPEWIHPLDSIRSQVPIMCRIQRTHPPVWCKIEQMGDYISVQPHIPLRATAPGQMCVFYAGNVCLGGGEVIDIQETLY